MRIFKFISIISLLLFSRGCDFYSTSLWFFQEGGMAGEMNPLTRFFNVGFNGLIAVNVVVVGMVTFLYFFYSFRYKRMSPLEGTPRNIFQFASLTYFNRPDRFYYLLIGMAGNRSPLFAHFGFVMTRTIIFVSFLATIHNLCQYYQVGVYDTFRSIVGRPHFVISGLSLLFLILTYRSLLVKEYDLYKKTIPDPAIPRCIEPADL